MNIPCSVIAGTNSPCRKASESDRQWERLRSRRQRRGRVIEGNTSEACHQRPFNLFSRESKRIKGLKLCNWKSESNSSSRRLIFQTLAWMPVHHTCHPKWCFQLILRLLQQKNAKLARSGSFERWDRTKISLTESEIFPVSSFPSSWIHKLVSSLRFNWFFVLWNRGMELTMSDNKISKSLRTGGWSTGDHSLPCSHPSLAHHTWDASSNRPLIPPMRTLNGYFNATEQSVLWDLSRDPALLRSFHNLIGWSDL